MTSETVTSGDGTRISYDRSGSGPVLIVVGGAASYRAMGGARLLIKALAADFTVVEYDRRGRGESGDADAYSPEREVEDLRAVVEATGGTAFAYGHSSGALLVLHAADAGVDLLRIALFEPPLDPERTTTDESELTATLVRLTADGRNDEAAAYFFRQIGVPDEIVAGMKKGDAWSRTTAIAKTLAYDGAVSDATTLALLQRVETPALVLDSSRTGAAIRRWADAAGEALPDATRQTLTGEWHTAPPDAIAAVLRDFFLT